MSAEIIDQANELAELQREAERYREQRDSANAMVQFLRDLFENGVALQPNQSVIVLNHAYEHLRVCDYCHKTHDDRLACPTIKNVRR